MEALALDLLLPRYLVEALDWPVAEAEDRQRRHAPREEAEERRVAVAALAADRDWVVVPRPRVAEE